MAGRRRRKSSQGENLIVAAIIFAALSARRLDVENFLPFLEAGFLVLLFALLVFLHFRKRRSSQRTLSSPSGDFIHSNFRAGFSAGKKEKDVINDLLAGEFWEVQDSAEMGVWSLPVLQSLEWKRFETVCCEYLRLIGYLAEETRMGADGGVDIWVYKAGMERPVGIVQCKAWSTYKVGVKPVREFYGVMASERVRNGKFITSGEFTREAIEFAEGKRLQLISGEQFLTSILKLPQDKQAELLDVALAGDYKTPTCPQCGVKMTLRQSSTSSKEFWGCPGFPQCRSTLVYKAEAA